MDMMDKFKLEKTIEEYDNKHRKFVTWRASKKINDNNDTTKDSRFQANKLADKLRKQPDITKTEEFIELSKKAIDMMDKFKLKKTMEEYDNKHLEFMKWISYKKINGNINGNNDTTRNSRVQANKLAAELRKQFDISKTEEFIKLANETMDMMDKFKQEYEDYELALKLQAELNN